jgi:hypothetical protein
MYRAICLVIAYERKDKSYEKPEDCQTEGLGKHGTPAFHGRRRAVIDRETLDRENLGEAGAGVEELAEGGEEAGDAESGCGCAGVVPGDGAGVSVGDQPDAAAGYGRRSERAGGITASASAVCAYLVICTMDMAKGEQAANKILFATQICTYNLCRGNKRKGLGDFWEVKPGLTRCDI